MKRLLKLYRMLNKSGKGAEEANGSIRLSSSTAFWTVVGLLVAAGLAWLCWKYAAFVIALGGVGAVLTLVGMLATILMILFGGLTLINGMYMSSDIEVLITLPFSAEQIALIRVIPFLKLGIGGTLCAMVAPCIGMALAAGVPAASWAASIFTAILLPIFVISIVAVVVILLMSFLKIFRSREVLRYIGMGFLFIGLCLYMYLCAGNQNINFSVLMTKLLTASAQVPYAIPVIGAATDFIKTGNPLYLLLEIVITAAAVGLFVLVTKALYLRGALNMQDAGNSRILTDAAFDKYCRKKRPMKALMGKEFLMTRRNPTYLLYNYIVGLLWPVLIVILMMQLIPTLKDTVTDPAFREMEASFSLRSFTIISPIIAATALLFVNIPLSMQTLAYSSLSREGKSFYIMKQLPISYAEQLEAKRRMADKVAQFSITGYSALLFIVVSIFLKISYLYCILPILMVFVYTEFRVNLDMYFGIRGANVTWDDEKTATRASTPIQFLGIFLMFLFAGLAAAIGVCAVCEVLPDAVCMLLFIVLGAFLLGGSLLLKKRIMTVGEKTIRRLRF